MKQARRLGKRQRLHGKPLPAITAIMSRAMLLFLGFAAALGGCHLVNQRTFVADADKPPKPPTIRLPPAPPAPSRALVVIRFPADTDWRDKLGVAVGLARSRKPNVLFTVESAARRSGSAADQVAVLSRAAADARAVADAILADGVDRSQIELTAATDPALNHEEVRIYVR